MKAFLNWSGGKDSAFCLFRAKQDGLDIRSLVTAVQSDANRVSMHGVRRTLVELQAEALQLPLHTIELSSEPGMKEYEETIRNTNRMLFKDGYTHVVSGDLFLEDLKNYRTGLYAKDHLHCLFPLWKMDSLALIDEFINSGFRAIIVCVNGSVLHQSFCGRMLDRDFIRDLPRGVDPCGENGEYHSFVFDGPIFQQPVLYNKGEIFFTEYKAPEQMNSNAQAKAGFYFQDLLPCTRRSQ